MEVGFVGAGRWGMTLAILLADKGIRVRMWEKSDTRRESLLRTRTVPDLPESVRIPESVAISPNLAEVLSGAEIVVLAVPAQALRECLSNLKSLLTRKPIVVSVMKGIELGTRKRVSQIIEEALPRTRIAVLTGPGIPYEVARGDPTSLVAAARTEEIAVVIRDSFSTANLRIYSSGDVVGAELGGALKNVIAIAAGIADGIGLGINAKSALLTRGLYEIMRLGTCLGANPMTLAGLSGMGDLIVTAFSPRSRNHQFGLAIARGESVEATIASLSGVAEGYYTCRGACELANRFQVDLPVITETYHILYESERPQDSIRRLLSRTLKAEVWA